MGSTLGGIGSVAITTEASVRDSLVSAPPASVWSALPAVFETLRVETPTLDPSTWVIGNPRYRGSSVEGRPLSAFLDCGSTLGGQRADTYAVTLYLVVQLAAPVDGGTMVRTVLDASARPRQVSGNAVHCASKGTLERRVMELLTQAPPAEAPAVEVARSNTGRNFLIGAILVPVAIFAIKSAVCSLPHYCE